MAEGENWAVLGSNGSGKSLLLQTLAGLRSSNNAITLDGRPVDSFSARDRAREISLLLQESEPVVAVTVLDAVLGARYAHLPAWRWETEKDLELAHAALRNVELEGLSNRALDTLSGGERRRCAIAAMLAQQTRIALWDEPTNHLDLHHQMAVLRLLSLRAQIKHALNVFVLHDVNLATRFCSHALLLFGDGRHLAGPIPEVINEASLSELYGCRIRRTSNEASSFYFPD